MSASPVTIFSSASCFCAAVMDPVSATTRVGRPAFISTFVMERACCSTSTSVGARKAHCAPLSTAWSMAISATMVLPEPTSPCSSRLMGTVRAMSRVISATTSFWPEVNGNGRRCTSRSSSRPTTRGSASALRASASARRTPMARATDSASSYFSRSSARAGPGGPGSWIWWTAEFRGKNPIGVKPRGSSIGGSSLSTACTAPMMVQVLTFFTAG